MMNTQRARTLTGLIFSRLSRAQISQECDGTPTITRTMQRPKRSCSKFWSERTQCRRFGGTSRASTPLRMAAQKSECVGSVSPPCPAHENMIIHRCSAKAFPSDGHAVWSCGCACVDESSWWTSCRYIRALVSADRLGQTNLSSIIGAGHTSGGRGSSSSSGASASGFGGGGTWGMSKRQSFEGDRQSDGRAGSPGTDEEPMVVQIQQPSTKAQFWKMLRSLIIILVVLSAVNQLMDGRGLGGGGAKSSEVKPDNPAELKTFDDVQVCACAPRLPAYTRASTCTRDDVIPARCTADTRDGVGCDCRGLTKPRLSSWTSSSFSETLNSSPGLGAGSQRVCFSRDLRGRARHCWRVLSRGKPACRSSTPRGLSLTKCLW